MRKRDIQSFSLKLSDLKEYESIREEKAQARNRTKEQAGASNEETLQECIIKMGPKSKQEIRVRIGLPME